MNDQITFELSVYARQNEITQYLDNAALSYKEIYKPVTMAFDHALGSPQDFHFIVTISKTLALGVASGFIKDGIKLLAINGVKKLANKTPQEIADIITNNKNINEEEIQ
jgi:hypothetical protein